MKQNDDFINNLLDIFCVLLLLLGLCVFGDLIFGLGRLGQSRHLHAIHTHSVLVCFIVKANHQSPLLVGDLYIDCGISRL